MQKKLMILTLSLIGVVSLFGCKKEETSEVVATPAPNPIVATPEVELSIVNMKGDSVGFADTFGSELFHLKDHSSYHLTIDAVDPSNDYITYMSRTMSESVINEVYQVTWLDKSVDINGEPDEIPRYGRSVELLTNKNQTILNHTAYMSDPNAFQTWYQTKHDAYYSMFQQATDAANQTDFTINPTPTPDSSGSLDSMDSTEPTKSEPIHFELPSVYQNAAAQMESKYKYYLDHLNTVSRCVYFDVYATSPNLEDIVNQICERSKFSSDVIYWGSADIDFNGGIYTFEKYELQSTDGLYSYIVFVDEFGEVCKLDKYIEDDVCVLELNVVYDLSDEFLPTMSEVNVDDADKDSDYRVLTLDQLESYIKQVTGKCLPIVDRAFEVTDFNVTGVTSIRSLFDARNTLTINELLTFGEPNGMYCDFDGVIFSAVDSEHKSVACRFIYQETPIQFVIAPTEDRDENDNKIADTYALTVMTSDDRNSNVWNEFDNVTDEQTRVIYELFDENLTELQAFELLPETFEFDISKFHTWFESYDAVRKPYESSVSSNEIPGAVDLENNSENDPEKTD